MSSNRNCFERGNWGHVLPPCLCGPTLSKSKKKKKNQRLQSCLVFKLTAEGCLHPPSVSIPVKGLVFTSLTFFQPTVLNIIIAIGGILTELQYESVSLEKQSLRFLRFYNTALSTNSLNFSNASLGDFRSLFSPVARKY